MQMWYVSFKRFRDNFTSIWRQDLNLQEMKHDLAKCSYAIRII